MIASIAAAAAAAAEKPPVVEDVRKHNTYPTPAALIKAVGLGCAGAMFVNAYECNSEDIDTRMSALANTVTMGVVIVLGGHDDLAEKITRRFPVKGHKAWARQPIFVKARAIDPRRFFVFQHYFFPIAFMFMCLWCSARNLVVVPDIIAGYIIHSTRGVDHVPFQNNYYRSNFFELPPWERSAIYHWFNVVIVFFHSQSNRAFLFL
jgi:hypothetical protein